MKNSTTKKNNINSYSRHHLQCLHYTQVILLPQSLACFFRVQSQPHFRCAIFHNALMVAQRGSMHSYYKLVATYMNVPRPHPHTRSALGWHPAGPAHTIRY